MKRRDRPGQVRLTSGEMFVNQSVNCNTGCSGFSVCKWKGMEGKYVLYCTVLYLYVLYCTYY